MSAAKYLAAAAALVQCAENLFAAYPITKIADTNTPVPGGVGTFTSFSIPVSDREDLFGVGLPRPAYRAASFVATTSTGVSGIYSDLSLVGSPISLSTLVDTNTAAIPGGPYKSFDRISFGDTEIAFIGTTVSGTQAVVEKTTGQWRLVAKIGDSPESGKTFGAFQRLSVMGDNYSAAPPGYNTSGEIITDIGVYRFQFLTQTDSPTFTRIADTTTAPPGGGSLYSSFIDAAYKVHWGSNIIGYQNELVLLHATTSAAEGLYLASAGPSIGPATIATTADTSFRSFTSFGVPSISSHNISFTAHYTDAGTDRQGIFVYGAYLDLFSNPPYPGLHQFAATGDLAPDSANAHFAEFSSASSAIGFYITFLATLDDGRKGLYLAVENGSLIFPVSLSKVLDTTDILDGKSIANIELSPEASGFNATSFKVDFTDGSQGLYYFQLPEPSALALLFLPALTLLRRRQP